MKFGFLTPAGHSEVIITPAAGEFVRTKRLSRSLRLADQIVREAAASMRAVHVDLQQDPDEGGYPTIRFCITTRESSGSAVDSYYVLRRLARERIRAKDRPYFSFTFQFEM